jgi:hypothetical protein
VSEHTLDVQLRVLPSGVVCRHGCAQAVTAQHSDDQFSLGAPANDCQHGRPVDDLNSYR